MNSTMRRSPRRFAAILLLLAALGVAACGSNSSSSSTSRRRILEHVGSCGDNEFPLDVRRLELERHPARAQRGRR